MINLLKLAAISAVLSVGVVTAFEAPATAKAPGAKAFQDRIAPDAAQPTVLADAGATGPRIVVSDASPAAPTECRAQTWPYVSRDCIQDGAPTRKVVRTITIERRDAPNTSTLVRLPVDAR